ncbi:MAG: hypothetical protein OXG52_12245, partial [bacterium]|nr:hypothetical protein [bacterium]
MSSQPAPAKTARHAGRARRLVRLALAGALIASAAVALASVPASGHTRLLETVPDNRTVTEAPPERLTFLFAEA